ncbi:MAG: hypothetical protein ACR2PT_21425 [Endozoicomonas sp.]
MADIDVNKRRAYLYQEVIELLFSPAKGCQANWVSSLLGSLYTFWGVDSYPGKPKKNGFEISADNIGITCEGEFRDDGYFSIDFHAYDFVDEEHYIKGNPFSWSHHVDPVRYFRLPLKAFLGQQNSDKTKALAGVDEEDVAAILDTLIFHPCEHMHIESCIPHQIRLGGGISNPFQYLFHLRYQFCPISDMQDAEKQRLRNLVYQALQSKSSSIEIKALMDVPSICNN